MVFEYIIAPFLYFIKWVYSLWFSFTGSHGASIVLLSFTVSLLLLPIFIYIEKTKKRNDAVKARMKPLVDEIKHCYRGQERYYYLKTLNRQHGFSPFKALVPILSLLLQIPFFIAAYQFLADYEPLTGTGFLFIDDLSQPDGLLGGIHLLPILMTVVNVVTAYLYTIRGDKSERNQMYVVAGLFLILLFNLPSGLVLYWTLNNVFSFFRLFITHHEVFPLFFSKLRKVIGRESIQGIRNILARSLPKIYFALLFISIYFFLASKYYFTEVNTSLLFISLFFVFPLWMVSVVGLLRYTKKLKAWQSNSLRIISFIVFGVSLLSAFALFKGESYTISFSQLSISIRYASWLGFTAWLLIFSLISLPLFVFEEFKQYNVTLYDKGWLIVILSSLYIAGNIFFWNPIIVFASYPGNFDFVGLNIVFYNFIPFLFLFVALAVLYILVPKKWKSLVIQFLFAGVIVVFLYSSIIPNPVGVLNVNHFSEQDNLAKPELYYLLEAGLLLGIIYGAFWIYKNLKMRIMLILLVAINVVVISHSFYLGHKTGKFYPQRAARDGIPQLVFSETAKNVVFFIVDAAQGWYMQEFVEQDESLKNTFSGFTYYPNTVSISNYTYASVPAMIAGEDFSIDVLNKDKEHSIVEKFSQATECFYDKIREQGYRFTSTIIRYSTIDHDKFDVNLPRWHNEWGVKMGLGSVHEIWYTRLWENALFSSVPFFLKPRIYNQTKWLVKEKETLNLSELNEYNFVRALPYISKSTKSGSPNFFYIHSLYTHDPWNLINEQGELVRNVHPSECQLAFTHDFAKWIEWMKGKGVYDNTKIILVSDHGPSWWHWWNEGGKITSNAPIVWPKDERISLERFLHLNPLLMVKDFGEQGEMKTDWRLMSNADAGSIAFNKENPATVDSVSRTVKTFYTKWHQDLKTRTEYELTHAFEVTDWVYDVNNWKTIE